MIVKRIITHFAMCGCFIPSLLQGQHLIPAPKEIIHTENYFSLDRRVSIEKSEVSEDNVAHLQELLKAQVYSLNREKNPPLIRLQKITSSAILKKKLEAYKLNSDYTLGEEGYLLKVDENSIEILAGEEAGIFPAMEESYDFLRDVYEEIVPSYDGAYFNINCDETFGLGEGKSKAMVDSESLLDGLFSTYGFMGYFSKAGGYLYQG